MKPTEISDKCYLNTPVYDPSFDRAFNTVDAYATTFFMSPVSLTDETIELATDAVNSGLEINDVLQSLMGDYQYNEYGVEYITLLDGNDAKESIDRLKNKGVLHLNNDDLLVIKWGIESLLIQHNMLSPVALDLKYTKHKIEACLELDYPDEHRYKNIFSKDEVSTVYDGLSNCIALGFNSEYTESMLSIIDRIEYAHPELVPEKTKSRSR